MSILRIFSRNTVIPKILRSLAGLGGGGVPGRAPRQSEWNLLRKYQLWLLYGGGVLVTLAICAAVGMTVVARFDSYIADQQQVFVAERNALLHEIATAETRMRRTVHAAEMQWKQQGSPASGAGVLALDRRLMRSGGQLVLDGIDGILPVEVFYLRKAGGFAAGASRRRYLALTRYIALQRTLSEKVHEYKLEGYFFDPQGDFVTVYPPSLVAGLPDPVRRRKLGGLVESIGAGVPAMADRARNARASHLRRVFWFGPRQDALSGQWVVSYSGVAYDGQRPFAVFVNNIPLEFLQDKIDAGRRNGTFFILPAGGTPVIAAPAQAALAGRIAPKVRTAIAGLDVAVDTPAFGRRGGLFMFAQRLPGTDWLAVCAFGWRDVVASLRHELVLVAGSAAGVLALLWGFLLFFNRLVFRPVHRRAKRVYESEQFNRTVIEMAPVGLCVLSYDQGVTLLQNDVMRALAQDVRDDGRPPLPACLLDAYREEARPGGPPVFEREIRVAQRDGAQAHWRIALVKTRYQGQRVLLCAVIDISAQKQLEEKLHQARRLSDQANRAKSAFLANMSHEIRTPMHGMLGHLELLALSPLSEEQAERVAIVHSSSQNLLQIINDILDLSKLESDHVQLEATEIDVADIVEKIALTLAPSAAKKGVKLYCLIDLALRHRLMGDGVRIAQIVTNLVNNAIKFTASGAITVRVGALEIRGGCQWLRFEVEDTGIGIDIDDQPKLFEPFTQADETISRRFGGTGLGLSLCKRLTQLMGGTIGVTSLPGQGSTFSVWLPLAMAAETEPPSLPLQGQQMVVLAPHAESGAVLARQLHHWGANAMVVGSVEQLPRPVLAADGLLLALDVPAGAVDGWFSQQMPGPASLWVDMALDGPLTPRRYGRAWQVSSYSRSSLLRAIRLAGSAVREPAAAPAVRHAEPHGVPALSGNTGRPRIMVVEDHPVNRQLLIEQLAHLGYETVIACHGKDAVAQFRRGSIDLVLTDISMPEIDGYQLTALLRQRGAHIPILATTANAGQEEWQRCRQAGIDDVLVKPSTLAQLRHVLSKWLGAWPSWVADPATPKDIEDVEDVRDVKDERTALATTVQPGGSAPPDAARRIAADPALRALLVSTLQDDLASLRQSMTAGDLHAAVLTVHRIKGAFATVKAETMLQSCLRLEACLKSGAGTATDEAWAALNRDIACFVAHWSVAPRVS